MAKGLVGEVERRGLVGKMGSMDVFLADIATSDTKKKLQIGENIVNYLGNLDNSIGRRMQSMP